MRYEVAGAGHDLISRSSSIEAQECGKKSYRVPDYGVPARQQNLPFINIQLHYFV
jgi:hypothetical protein